MKYIIKRNNLVFLILFIANLLMSIIAFFVLPDKFFYDSIILVEDTYKEIGFFGSYPFAILFYKITLLRYLAYPLVSIIQYPVLMYIIYKIGIPTDFHKLNARNIIIYIGFFLLALYVSMPSKEFITFLIVSLVPYIFLLKNKLDGFKIRLALFVFIAFSFFRSYYLLIPIIAISMYLFSFIKVKNKAVLTVFYGIIISIFISLSSGLITGKFITQSTREQLNETREILHDKDTNSKFVSPIPADTWYGETISILNGFFAVNIPVYEGLKLIFKPQVIAFVIWQLSLLYILLVKFSKCLREKHKFKFEFWSLLILFSYYIVQGLFEPDLGSAIRHKIGFFPLIYFIFYYDDFRKKVQTNI